MIKSVEEEKSYYSKVDHIICLSSYRQKIMHCYYGFDTSKISVIPNGLFDMADSA
ncbi:MAG: glycosyltransferase [Tannerellaceae bacterium]|nr:glycosyltransferase [Tannerellaceae bacterium]